MEKKFNTKALGILVFLSIGTLGFMWNLQGPAVPFIMKDLKINYTAIGILLAIGATGYLSGTLIGGLIADKFGNKTTLMSALVLSGLGASAIILGETYILVIILFFIMQFGFGLFEASCNSITAVVFTRNTAVMFNILHMSFGIGAMGGTQFSGQMLAQGVSWKMIYLFSAIVCVTMIIYLAFIKVPNEKHVSAGGLKNLHKLLKSKRLWAWSVVLGGAMLLEIGIANWLSNYLQTVFFIPVNKAATYLTIFFAFFTGGRLITGFLAQKIGYRKFIWISMSLAVALVITGLILGHIGIYLIISSGLLSAGLFPTVMAALTDEYKKNIGIVFGFSIAFAGVVSMCSNYLVGFISNFAGPAIGFLVMPIMSFGTAILAFMLAKSKTVK